MCDFSHLSANDKVDVTYGSCMYRSCYGDMIGLTVKAIYQGHITDGTTYDVFRVIGSVCPHCKVTLNEYRQKCDTQGVWHVSELSKVKHETF